MKFIDFFSGVGGFTHGMELAGHECIGHCEFDKYAEASYRSMHTITESQREYLLTLPLKQRQKEILKYEYLNGEWYADDVCRIVATDMPKAECWCFGFPCQDISIAGKQRGFKGNRSSLFFRVTNILKQLKEEDRPNYLFIENVRNLISINRGYDFARLFVELAECGYNAEWQILNSKHHGVPQNRERIFIIGHFGNRSKSNIFPIERASAKNSIKQIGQYTQNSDRGNPSPYRVYSRDGISPCLTTHSGGENSPHVIQPFGIDKSCNKPRKIDIANCIIAREDSGVSNHKAKGTAIAIPVLTPDRTIKKQNGRRFKENGEPSFTLTTQDRHGVAIDLKALSSKTRGQPFRYGHTACLDHNCYQGVIVEVTEGCNVWAIWSEKYNCYMAVRKLTPKECFRLQGWEDKYFERAEQFNSNSQLYKQAGNGVTVNVIKHIAERM
jgi:DNA (cytosine-5)-methyltransferase 1